MLQGASDGIDFSQLRPDQPRYEGEHFARVAAGLVERQTKYYKENIGNVKSVDEFLNNYQLYSYAMDAFGLGEMTYAKAFMKKVLDSDLNDRTASPTS